MSKSNNARVRIVSAILSLSATVISLPRSGAGASVNDDHLFNALRDNKTNKTGQV